MLLSIFVNKECWCIYFIREVSFSVQYATLFLALQPRISMMYSFIWITRSSPHLYGCFVFAKRSTVRSQYTNWVLMHYCNMKKKTSPFICGFLHPFTAIVSPEAMFWASSGPASHCPFPRTATSFLFLNFCPLLPDLLPISPLGTVSLENHRARFCHWVSQVTEVEIYTVVVSAFVSIWKISGGFICTLGWKVSLKAAETTQTHNCREGWTHDYHLWAGKVTASFYWPCRDLLHHVGNITFLLSIIKINLISTQQVVSLW